MGGEERPVYESRTGFDQRGLLKLARQFTTGNQISEGTIVQSTHSRRAAALSPLDALGHRLADGSITIEEFRERRAVLVEFEPVAPTVTTVTPEEPELPEGVRLRDNGRYQAMWRDAEGKQRSVTVDTLDEALEARAEALAIPNVGTEA